MVLFAVPVGQARAAIANLNEAINKAGRMRMLSQRMAKAYFQLGQGILPDASRRLLDASIKLYQEHLEDLKAYAPSSDIQATYAELETIWLRYRQLLASTPGLEPARRIAEVNEDALRVAHLGTTQLELHSTSSVGRLVNISGRQRMLSQRMAKFYMMRRWGIGGPTMDSEAQVARREFMSALDALERAPENTPKIRQELELARTQWLFFEQALRQERIGDKDSAYAANVATTSERILEVMDRVTNLYAKLPGSAPLSAPSGSSHPSRR
ncbi:MAG: hypothetical protein FJZ96_15400 [Chloroflexi bacterium]|nr:hypothetical protein [Chloroflexota bacterium]